MRRLIPLFVVAVSLFIVIGCNKDAPMSSSSGIESDSQAAGHHPGPAQLMAEYEVVIENITPNNGNGASQPFSPPVLATHTPRFHVFREGRYASYELQNIAEDAVSGPMESMLGTSPFVYDYTIGGGVVLPGQSETFTIKARVGFRYLSLVAMLVNTNDGFVGADGIRLPVLGSETHYLYAYDAGTEKNTELKAHIPGPCCGSPGVRVPEHKKIDDHDGIQGVGDLDPQVWGWDGPVARITITLKSIG